MLLDIYATTDESPWWCKDPSSFSFSLGINQRTEFSGENAEKAGTVTIRYVERLQDGGQAGKDHPRFVDGSQYTS